MEKTNKLSLPVVILISSIVIGGFYYASQVSKQNSIERQQVIKIEEERRIKEEGDKQVEAEKKRIEGIRAECNGRAYEKGKATNNVETYNLQYQACLREKGQE